MRGPLTLLRRHLALRGESGQGMVEYGLILVFVALVVILALTFFGTAIHNSLGNSANSLGNY